MDVKGKCTRDCAAQEDLRYAWMHHVYAFQMGRAFDEISLIPEIDDNRRLSMPIRLVVFYKGKVKSSLLTRWLVPEEIRVTQEA
jgi:hypothetical protein